MQWAIDNWPIIAMAVPSLLGGLKILAKTTKTDVDDKIIDGLLKVFTVMVPRKK